MGRSTSELLGALVAVTAVATLPLGILATLFIGWQLGTAVFVLGWFLVVPTLAILAGVIEDDERERVSDRDAAANESDPLETLRERYARGEIGEAEFERRVDELLETDPDEPESRVGGREREYE
ncbi:SHOCT domain-containing protein [Halovivax limisalsi]|uniref:SHOCT domain-containing protein n=1 Tax=Halovivax limisalsi TaxID=1453760 RepID=UPI001FFDD501|nr:SHOCT domain-containing protein [Halovivax limisalsi]